MIKQRIVSRLMFALVVVSALGTGVLAMQMGMQQGHGMGPGHRMPRYDPKTEVTVNGIVEEAKDMERSYCGANITGTHLLVKADQRTLDVHLGPTNFLASKKFSFEKGDSVEITGSNVKLNGEDVLIAREVKKANNTLTLRNSQGIPLWSRGGRRGK